MRGERKRAPFNNPAMLFGRAAVRRLVAASETSNHIQTCHVRILRGREVPSECAVAVAGWCGVRVGVLLAVPPQTAHDLVAQHEDACRLRPRHYLCEEGAVPRQSTGAATPLRLHEHNPDLVTVPVRRSCMRVAVSV